MLAIGATSITSTEGRCATTTGTAVSTETSEAATTMSQAERPQPSPLSQMHYESRVRSFRDQNLVYQNVVLLGDSITEALDVQKYLPGRRVLNRGIGSDVIGNNLVANDKRGVLKRLEESVFNCSPTDVFIMIGINDLGQDHTPDVIGTGYREMLTVIRNRMPRLKLHLQSVLPTRGKFAKLNPDILKVNEQIKALAAEYDCEYIDLHQYFADDTGELKEELTEDGLHLLPPAYKTWADLLEEKMDWAR